MMRKLGSGRGIRHASQLATGTAIAQAAPLIVTPILSRQYAPAQFGEFGIFAAILLGLSLVISGRYELAIPLPRRDADALGVLALSVLVSAALSAALLGLALVLLFFRSGPALLELGIAPGVVLLVPPAVLSASVAQSCSYWFTRKQRFSLVARLRASQGVGVAVMGVTFGSLGTPLGLVISLFLGHVLLACVLLVHLLREAGSLLREVRLNELASKAKEYRDFPLLNGPSTLLDAVRESGTLMLFGSMFGTALTGQLTQTLRLMRAPMSLVGQAVAQVFFPKASKMVAEGRSIARLTTRTMLGVTGVSAPLYLAVFLAGPQVFTFVLGAQWTTAGEYARILAPWLTLVLVTSSLSLLPVIRGKQQQGLALNITATAARLAGLLVGAAAGGATGAVIGIAVAGFAICVVQLVWYHRLACSDVPSG